MPADYLDRVSCFETMRVYGGGIFRVSAHLERLRASCRTVGSVLPESIVQLKRWSGECVASSGLKQGNGVLRLSWHEKPAGAGELVLILRPFSGYPERWLRDGIDIRTSVGLRPSSRSQDARTKSSEYVSGVLGRLDDPEAIEQVFLNPLGYVTEGAVSNLFLVKEKCVLTPATASGILEGVTRAAVIEIARDSGLKVRETILTRHDLYAADELFLTNTTFEIMPVRSVDERAVRSGSGPVTRRLHEQFNRLVRKELNLR